MKFWIDATNETWYANLSRSKPDEANLWKPSDLSSHMNQSLGMPILFGLGTPHNKIAGGGFFVTQSTLPAHLAWEIFGSKNGYPDLPEFQEALHTLRGETSAHDEVFCTVLANTKFFEQDSWLPCPSDWDASKHPGKIYDTNTLEDQTTWNEARRLLLPEFEPAESVATNHSHSVDEERSAYGQERLIRPRLGQSAFRMLVTDAYQRRCAITGEKTLVALEAAHIVPFAREQTHDVKNGLLLRADFHRLFDVGLVSISPALNIMVSPKIREDWFNGKAYYRLDGQPMTIVPESQDMQPDRDRLKWHVDNVYQR